MDFVDLRQFRITTPFALPEIVPYSSGTADSGSKSHRVSRHVTTRPLQIKIITTVTLGVRDLAGINRSPGMARKHRKLVWQKTTVQARTAYRPSASGVRKSWQTCHAVRQTAKLRFLSPVTCHFDMLSNLT